MSLNLSKPFFSVFTPTYNRADTLIRVYNSLLQQTDQDFEWIIVDDGSIDDTKQIVENWIHEKKINITYTYQENAGKHNAINLGVSLAKGFLFIIADSDDEFISDSLKIFKKNWENIEPQIKEKIASIWVLCVDELGNIIGDKFPKDEINLTYFDRVYKYKIKGEKWHADRLEIMKKFPFPNYKMKGMCISEGYVWRLVNEDYLFKCINIPLRKYFNSDDGIMAQMKIKSKARVYSDYVNLGFFLDFELKYFFYSPFTLIYCGISYLFSSIYLMKRPFKTRRLSTILFLMLISPMLPIYYLFKIIKSINIV